MGVKSLNSSPPYPVVWGQNLAPSLPHHFCRAGKIAWDEVGGSGLSSAWQNYHPYLQLAYIITSIKIKTK